MEETTEFNMGQEEKRTDQFEFIESPRNEKKKCCLAAKFNGNMIHWIVEGVLLLAVIVLFVLHFADSKKGEEDGAAPVVKVATKPGNGNVLYVNLDTINECQLFKEKQELFDTEEQRLMAPINERDRKWAADSAQFMKNLQSNKLTEEQIEYTYQSLQEQKMKIESDRYAAAMSLMQKQTDLTNEMYDILREAANAVNCSVEGDPASYVFTYSANIPTLILVDPSRDITAHVVAEMNKKCSKKSDK